MARPTFPRNVGFLPGVTYFKPAGVRMVELEEVVLGHDEIEAMRLKHLQGLSQEEAAGQMNISQPTFHRLLFFRLREDNGRHRQREGARDRGRQHQRTGKLLAFLRERQDVRAGPARTGKEIREIFNSIKEAP